MTNAEFLKKFLKLQFQIGYDRLYEIGNSKIVYSETDYSIYSNYAYLDEVISKDNLTKIEDLFKTLKRTSTIYFEDINKLDLLLRLLNSNKFTQKSEDSWMFHSAENIDESRFDEIKIVKTAEELEIFLRTFDRSYQVNDPQNPYGDVKSFIPSCRNAWFKFGSTNRLKYYLAYKNEEPVATSILNSLDCIGYISAVGSLKNVEVKVLENLPLFMQ